MKRVIYLLIVAALLFGCAQAPEKPAEAPERPSVKEKPRVYTFTIMERFEKPLLGEGTVRKGQLVPESASFSVGDTIQIHNRDFAYETVQIIGVKKDYKSSKFKTYVREDLERDEILEFTFEEPGEYKIMCILRHCVSTIGVV